MLYEYAKMHPKEKLPEVYSIIYYHGKKTYSHATNIWEQFHPDYDAKTYIFTPNFIDLNKINDQILLSHQPIAGAEFAFKHIFENELDKHTETLAQNLNKADGEIIKTVLRYVYQAGQTNDSETLINNIANTLNDKENNMTVAEYLKQKGFEQGLHQGINQGIEQGKLEEARIIAKELRNKGLDLELIKSVTKLSNEDLAKLTQNH